MLSAYISFTSNCKQKVQKAQYSLLQNNVRCTFTSKPNFLNSPSFFCYLSNRPSKIRQTEWEIQRKTNNSVCTAWTRQIPLATLLFKGLLFSLNSDISEGYSCNQHNYKAYYPILRYFKHMKAPNSLPGFLLLTSILMLNVCAVLEDLKLNASSSTRGGFN